MKHIAFALALVTTTAAAQTQCDPGERQYPPLTGICVPKNLSQ